MNWKNFFARFTALGFLVLAMTVFANAQNSKTKSLISKIKAEFPERQKQIAEKCDGASVVVDVDFASFGDNYDALLRVPSQGLKEMTYGVRRFCTNKSDSTKGDPEKVGALKSKVKKIMLKQVANASDKKISLQSGGVVLIEMAFHDLKGGLSHVEIERGLGEIL